MQDFKEASYQAHRAHYEEHENSLSRLEQKETIDYWRHERMYELMNPLLQSKDNSWLTVGDGIGTDANWLLSKGVTPVASDISDFLLQKAKDRGYINQFSIQNAEQMTFEDGAFDYVLCKEAYHHFPRPYIALYEMIRVAKQAVILIEPLDIGVQMPLIIFIKNILDRFSPKWIDKVWKNRFSFETVGNYVYKVSEREMEKVAMGINLPYIAFKGLNDHYSQTIDTSQPKTNAKEMNKMRFRIGVRNLLSRIGLIPYQLQSCIIFKITPTGETIRALHQMGYKLVQMPKNPYI